VSQHQTSSKSGPSSQEGEKGSFVFFLQQGTWVWRSRVQDAVGVILVTGLSSLSLAILGNRKPQASRPVAKSHFQKHKTSTDTLENSLTKRLRKQFLTKDCIQDLVSTQGLKTDIHRKTWPQQPSSSLQSNSPSVGECINAQGTIVE
jgi:hypothetical protein